MNESSSLPGTLQVPGDMFILAELHAMKLDGVLDAVVGDVFRPRALAETPAVRAGALKLSIPAALEKRAVLGQLAAAWVYGCAPPPQIISLLVDNDGNTASLPARSGCTLRQVYLDAADVRTVGGALVTSPLRTAVDVARSAPEAMARAVLAAMVARPSLLCTVGGIQRALAAATHVPGKLRAQEIVRSMLDAGQ
ncbi:hypothetical protein ACX80E_07665 [Arthrobacter sp. TMN-49]